MAANFPTKNLSDAGDTFTSNGTTFVWDGTTWKRPTTGGVKGQTGQKGEKGEKGEKGDKGEKGAKGVKGEKGQKGEKGEKGAIGQKGEGDKGQKGSDNSTKGQKGELGDKGQKGQKGEDNSTKGDKGATGPDNSTKGQKGDQGDKGQKGSEAGNANTVTVRTDNGNEYHNLVFVDSTTDNQDQILKMDDDPSTLQWNPDQELLVAYTVAARGFRPYGNATYGNAGDVLTSGGSGSDFTWSAPSSLTYSVPQGGIIIWSGNSGNIPSGWVLCDGSNSTPDLRDKFLVGASAGTGANTYPGLSPGATGGYTDTPIINHNHTFSASTSNDGAHTHTYNGRSGTSRCDNDEDHQRNSGWSSHTTSSAGGHAHNFNGTTNSASNSINSGAGRNLPPYYALCYIMKT